MIEKLILFSLRARAPSPHRWVGRTARALFVSLPLLGAMLLAIPTAVGWQCPSGGMRVELIELRDPEGAPFELEDGTVIEPPEVLFIYWHGVIHMEVDQPFEWGECRW